ncbi:hypothetical protein BU16DRAFT_562287 [Lophium mytilinum]|uniref:Uncharacterized protein n=1 Tax=Lophium mytilinum TaxID=390894 RepID=A0A6A6QUN2_9PEZI|nr:hypothetical protein BU16DRAFT_562287 [Lophium mytilinum]
MERQRVVVPMLDEPPRSVYAPSRHCLAAHVEPEPIPSQFFATSRLSHRTQTPNTAQATPIHALSSALLSSPCETGLNPRRRRRSRADDLGCFEPAYRFRVLSTSPHIDGTFIHISHFAHGPRVRVAVHSHVAAPTIIALLLKLPFAVCVVDRRKHSGLGTGDPPEPQWRAALPTRLRAPPRDISGTSIRHSGTSARGSP